MIFSFFQKFKSNDAWWITVELAPTSISVTSITWASVARWKNFTQKSCSSKQTGSNSDKTLSNTCGLKYRGTRIFIFWNSNPLTVERSSLAGIWFFRTSSLTWLNLALALRSWSEPYESDDSACIDGDRFLSSGRFKLDDEPVSFWAVRKKYMELQNNDCTRIQTSRQRDFKWFNVIQREFFRDQYKNGSATTRFMEVWDQGETSTRGRNHDRRLRNMV